MLIPLSYFSISKIKILLGLLYKYALENDIVNINYAQLFKTSQEGRRCKRLLQRCETQKD